MKLQLFSHIILIIFIFLLVTNSQITNVYGDKIIWQEGRSSTPVVRIPLGDDSVHSSADDQVSSERKAADLNRVDSPTPTTTSGLVASDNFGTFTYCKNPPLNYLGSDNSVTSITKASQTKNYLTIFPYNHEKKIIEFGSDAPNAKWIKDNIASMEQKPFDGVAFVPGSRVENIWWQGDASNNTNVFDFNSLSAIKWKKFSGNNFILLFSVNHPEYHLDYWDDTKWSKIQANMGVYGKSALDYGCAGVLIDPEIYHRPSPWNYTTVNNGHSLAETQKKVRERGAQVMNAIQKQYSNITIIISFMSLRKDTKYSSDYELLPYWINGMLDVIGPDARLVDGDEHCAYWYGDTSKYFSRYDESKITKSKLAYLSPNNEDKWAKNVEVGSAMYWEANNQSNNVQVVMDRWEHQTFMNLASTDEWTFVYSRTTNWWGIPIDSQPLGCNVDISDVPFAAVDGISNAKGKYRDHKALGWDWSSSRTFDYGIKDTSVTVNTTSTNPVIVSASSINGPISKVDFYLNSVLVDSDYSEPYSPNLTNVPAGFYTVIARAIDSKGHHGTSQPVDIIPPFMDMSPSITSISPASGYNTGNVAATISGTNFHAGAKVTLMNGNIRKTCTISAAIMATRLKCTLPIKGLKAGTWSLIVTNPDGTTVIKKNAFTVKPSGAKPTITKIITSKSCTTNTNSVVTITGANFRTGAVVQIIKGTTVKKATITSRNSIKIICTLPTKKAAPGQWNVKITNTDGTTVTKAGGITVKGSSSAKETEAGQTTGIVLTDPVPDDPSSGVPSPAGVPASGGLVPIYAPTVSMGVPVI